MDDHNRPWPAPRCEPLSEKAERPRENASNRGAPLENLVARPKRGYPRLSPKRSKPQRRNKWVQPCAHCCAGYPRDKASPQQSLCEL